MRSKKFKKIFNIILAIVLVLGVLSASFGVYAVAVAGKGEGDTAENGEIANAQGTEQQNAEEPYQIPGTTDAPNIATLKENVKIYSDAQAQKISNALVSVNSPYDDYNNGGRMSFVFNGAQQDLFGDLANGGYFYINGAEDSSFENSYIMKVSNIREAEGQTFVEAIQPELTEVFDNIDVGFNDVLTEKNLVSSQTIDGVTAHFGDASTEITDVSYTEEFDTNPILAQAEKYADNKPVVGDMANDYSTEPTDFIVDLVDIDLKKADDSASDGKNTGMTGDAGTTFKLSGSFGIEDLSAYMVCDMPQPAQFNELMFGLRGKKIVKVNFEGGVEASFQPQATKLEFDGKFIDLEVSGLNEKWIPLGIWQFVGTTLINVKQSTFDAAKMSPSIFVMLYMDASGNFEVKFNAGFTYSSTFNSGLSVFKNGEMNMNVVNYPYTAVNNSIAPANTEENKWYVDLSANMDASVTFFGASVQFYFAGINIGEIQIIDLGIEAKGNVSVSADSVDGIKTSNNDGTTSLYLRGFLKAIGLRAKVSAEVEAFQRKVSSGTEFAYRLVDVTLFEFGENPNPERTVPVSSEWVPDEFSSVVCMVCDVSGSMSGDKINQLKQAAHIVTNVAKNSAGDSRGTQGISVIQFASNSKTIAVPHIDYDFINKCIDTMGDGGGTNIASGLESAVQQLIGVNSKQKIILLMSDGEDSNLNASLEQAQLAADNDIMVYTIGFGSGANEEYLRQVAETGKGEYRFSSTDSIVGIISGFLYTYESAQGKVLADVEDTVQEGETKDVKSFSIPENNGDLNTTLCWPGSTLDLILLDPNGRRVDEEYPGAVIDKSDITEMVTVKEPLPGKWKIKVKGVETSYEDEPFYAIASFKNNRNAADTNNPELETLTLAGAYCLPIGVFMILLALPLLILINKKKDKR